MYPNPSTGHTPEEKAKLLQGVGTPCDIIKLMTGVDIYAGYTTQNVQDVPKGIPAAKPKGM